MTKSEENGKSTKLKDDITQKNAKRNGRKKAGVEAK